MSLRIGVAMLAHETNTFADDSTGTTDYDRFDVWHGDAFFDFWKGTRLPPAGMFDAIAEWGEEMVPLYGAFAQPSGTINRDAYERLRDELLSAIKENLPMDCIALCLHGAGVAEGIDEIETDIAQQVRALVGPDVPVVGVFDLHGNVTDAMAEPLDALFGFRLYPHEDMYERGEEAVKLLPALLAGQVHPTTHIEYVPMLLPPSTTDHGPAAEANRLCEEIERRPGIVDCTVFHGFPYADVPNAGLNVVAISDGDPDAAREAASEVARWCWEHREEFRASDPIAEEAIERALAVDGGPVVINETSDNCGGGAPGDATHLLRALLEARVETSCYGFIYDPEVAKQAHAAGVGATIDAELGGKHGDLGGKPLQVSGYVKSLTDGKFKLQSGFGGGWEQDLGPSVRLQIEGTDVLVASAQSQVFDPEIFLLHGVDVTRYKIVALKSSQHFRAGFRSIAKEIVTADTPGITTTHVEFFERRRNRFPLWPVDPAATYPGGDR